jgi:hypothetical protein
VSLVSVTGCWLDDRASVPGRNKSFCLYLSHEHRGSLRRGLSGQGLKLITDFHLVLRSRKGGAVPPLPRMS